MIPFIYANPVIQAVQSTGTEVLVRHASCSDKKLMGYFQYDGDKDIDRVVLCADNHTNISDLADTIRHEAWHVVQACYGGQILTSEAIAKFAHKDDIKAISSYPKRQQMTELAARNVARYTSETFVVKNINKFCFN